MAKKTIRSKTKKTTQPKADPTEVLKAFEFHGIDLDGQETQGQIICDCPLCGKEEKFFINTIERGNGNGGIGSCDCKVCHFTGNIYSLLSALHKEWLSTTSDNRYKQLADHRRKLKRQRPGLTQAAYKRFELAWDNDRQRWIAPVYNYKGSVVNLLAYDPTHEKPKWFSTAGLKRHAFNARDLSDSRLEQSSLILLCEGEWDAIAMASLLDALPQKHEQHALNTAIVAVPSGGIPKYELERFAGKEVWVLFDADTAGEKGVKKVVQDQFAKLPPSKRPESAKWLAWPENTPDGRDIGDLIGNSQRKAQHLWGEIKDLMAPIPFFPEKEGQSVVDQHAPALSRTSFKEVIGDFKKHGVSVNRNFHDALAVSAATVLASECQGDPVWMFLVAPSGGGKSLIIESAMTSNQCIYRGGLGPKDLVSGYQDDDDRSLLNQLTNPDQKCLLIKDFTGVICLPSQDVNQIFGILREAFDGRYSRTFGNFKECDYQGYFTVLAGVTPRIHKLAHSDVGERFLKYDLGGRAQDRAGRDAVMAAIMGVEGDQDVVNKRYRQESLRSYLDHIRDKKPPKLNKVTAELIINLAEFIAACRAVVDRDQQGALNYKPDAESPTRLAKQLTQLTRHLCLVLGIKSTSDPYILRIIRKVAWDTAYGRKRNTYSALYAIERMTSKQAKNRLDYPETTMERTLEDMRAIGVLSRKKRPKNENQKGRPVYDYSLSNQYRRIWETSKLSELPQARK